jgi:hypothetical protein
VADVTQPTLFDAPPAPWRQVREAIAPPAHRRRDPETSIAAARRKAGDQPSECEQIAAYLRGHPAGRAAWEVDADLGWEDFEEVARRLSDLERGGVTFRLKATRAGGGHGPCHVHVHARFGGLYGDEDVYRPPRARAT